MIGFLFLTFSLLPIFELPCLNWFTQTLYGTMVNPGHASKGCTTCKMRRIRCDYSRPFCLRCAKSKRVCLGYDTQKEQATASHKRSPIYNNADLMIQPSAIVGKLDGMSSLSSSDYYKTNTSAGLPHIDRFINIFTPLYGGKVDFQPTWQHFYHDLGTGRKDLARVVWRVLNTLNTGFYSLHQSMQTIAARKDLLERYGSAIRELREALTNWPTSLALVTPVFHFSLYEMVVNLDPADRTWQTHLYGLLSILRQLPGNFTRFTLIKAIKISESAKDVHKALELSTADGLERACLLLDIVKLQLRKLVTEMDTNANISLMTVRKLDMQKLRVSIKYVQKQLDLFPMILRETVYSKIAVIGIDRPRSGNQTVNESQFFVTLWNDFYTLRIITSTMLLNIGSVVYPNAVYSCKREFTVLSSMIQEAVSRICSITAYYIGSYPQATLDCFEMPVMKTTQALTLIWPLSSVLIAPDLTDQQQNWVKNVLRSIGEQCTIPKALSLACTGKGNIPQSDILAGILLVSLLNILPQPTFFYERQTCENKVI
ncbi:hypothetical protein N5P37_011790 [Trichoderma harzianum]|nr:hypothetical protein N5P37_011790 [Trichoderma harzianum]